MSTTPEPGAGPQPIMYPDDEHNRRLLAEVHPREWRNPKPEGRYHLAVVGGGTAGLVTAAIAAALGARVALVERHLMGGDCLNVGCVPSKAVLEAAREWKSARGAAAEFGGPRTEGSGDFGAVMERMRRIRAAISAHDGAGRFRDLGVDVYLGHAELVGSGALAVDGTRLQFKRAVIAAGTRPVVPSIPGLVDSGYHTNETIFSLTELPPRLVVIGGGSIGCELAQAFARFGSKVTVLEASDRLLPNDDPDAVAVLAHALREDGIEVITGAEVTEVRREGSGRAITYAAGGGTLTVRAEEVLVATGRVPNVEGMGLTAAGVDADAKKGIVVDDRLRTTNPQIYAIGDVASPYRFTHAADAQARLVVRNALFFGRGKASDLVIPWCTYTSPELAQVGRIAPRAPDTAPDANTVTVGFDEVDRARLDGRTDGFFRVVLEPRSDTILGATIVGEQAGELIPFLTHAMTNDVGLSALGNTIFPYPTRAEVLRKAADRWRRGKLTAAAKRAFGVYFRLSS